MKIIKIAILLFAACTAYAAQKTTEGWPREILADSDKLQVRFESRSFWTIYRVKYDGQMIGIDKFGSNYGSVAMFPGIGFIGSGHRENEDEIINKIKLYVDGIGVKTPKSKYKCKTIRLEKWSTIKNLKLYTDIIVKNNRIYENVSMSATEPTKLKLIYHFMYPWAVSTTDYIAETIKGKLEKGKFNNKGFKLNKQVKWSAVYDSKNQFGAIIKNVTTPKGTPCFTKYWDTPDRYKKHYLHAMSNSEVKPGKEYKYSVEVIPFIAPANSWEKKVKELVKD